MSGREMVSGHAALAEERSSHDVSGIIKEKMKNSVLWFHNFIRNRSTAQIVILVAMLLTTSMLYGCVRYNCTTQNIKDSITVTDCITLTLVLQPKSIGDIKFDTKACKFFLDASTLLEEDKEVNDNNLLHARDDNLASGSNTTCLLSDDQVNCSWVNELSELLFLIGSALEIFYSSFLSSVHKFFSRIFSNNCTSSTRNGSQSNARFLRLLLTILLICYNFKNVACDINGADLTLDCTSFNITVQGRQVEEQYSPSEEPLQPEASTGQELTTNPTHEECSNVTPAASFSPAENKTFSFRLGGLVDKVCPMTQLLHQLDVLTPDIANTQSKSFGKVTSSMYAMGKFFCSKSTTHEVQLDDHTLKKSRKKLPQMRLTLRTCCIAITLLLLIIILSMYLCFHPHLSHVQEINPGSSHLMVYPFHSETTFSQDYIKMSAPSITGTHNCSFPYQMTGDDSAFSNVFNTGTSEKGILEYSRSDVYKRQCSESAGGNVSEIVGISFQLPVLAREKNNKNDFGVASEKISGLPCSDDTGHLRKREDSPDTEESLSDAKEYQCVAEESQSVVEESQSVSGKADKLLYSSNFGYVPESCGTPVYYHKTPLKGFASQLGSDTYSI